ncbi:helix-turn-helix transcriptional regulator [Nocardia sp. NPDC058176]|uniref:helix-turn-helix transcriptional regulator n=1 Tax=Nocardia sp. NPDC058176 TaxID=3346368 RepID=UPI0036DE92D8
MADTPAELNTSNPDPIDPHAPELTPHAPRREVLTTTELADEHGDYGEYGFTVGTLRYWRHIGYGPASFALGRRVFYRRTDVEKWITEEEERTRRGGTTAAA